MNDSEMMFNPSAVLDSPNVICECGCKTFVEMAVLKKVSGLLLGTGKDEIVPIPVFGCAKCGKIPAEFMEKANAKKIMGEIELN